MPRPPTFLIRRGKHVSTVSDQQSAISSQLKAPLEDLPRPDVTLGIKPKIKTDEEAETALREIAWCQAVTSAIAAKTAELLNEINELATKVATFTVGEEQVPIADRRKVLEEAFFKFAEANRSRLCPGKKKSVEFRNGSCKWRYAKDAVDFLDDWSQRLAIEAVGNESGLLAKIEELVDAIGWHGVFVAKLSVNKTNAVKARQKQQLTDDELAEVGLEFKPGEEYITVEPAEFVRPGV